MKNGVGPDFICLDMNVMDWEPPRKTYADRPIKPIKVHYLTMPGGVRAWAAFELKRYRVVRRVAKESVTSQKVKEIGEKSGKARLREFLGQSGKGGKQADEGKVIYFKRIHVQIIVDKGTILV